MSGDEVVEPVDPVTIVLRAVADAGTALADQWPNVEQDSDVRWTTVALAEQVAALLRGDHRRALQLANQINESVDAAVGLVGGSDR
jgi:hypothetical protein